MKPTESPEAPQGVTMTDTVTGEVTECETYSIFTDVTWLTGIECSDGTVIGPFKDYDDAFDYLIAMKRSR